MATSIWTIGHSTRRVEELVGLLASCCVVVLVDVRSIPRSRHNPQFDSLALSEDLHRAGITYRHEPGLGGLRRPRSDSRNTAWRNPGFRGFADYMESGEFAARLDELVQLAGRERVAVMCAEAVPWRCHRMMIADAVTARGIEVKHILGPGRSQTHAMTPYARVEGGQVTYPGLG